MAKPVIQNKEMAKFETKISYIKNNNNNNKKNKKIETNPNSFKSDLKSTSEYIEYY